MPAIREIQSPFGAIFSISTNTVSAAIQMRFITPSTNKRAMINQQQPRQKIPCSSPIRKAPALPSFQLVIRKPMGVLHLFKQAFLIGVHWKIPADINKTPREYYSLILPSFPIARNSYEVTSLKLLPPTENRIQIRA